MYPISAKQYISGAWVAKETYSYINGEWVPWVTYLYNSGDTCYSTTGGWSVKGIGYHPDASSAVPSCVYYNTYARVYLTATAYGNGSSGLWHTANEIDLTPYSKVSFTISGAYTGDYNCIALIAVDESKWNLNYLSETYASIYLGTNPADGTYVLDISNVNTSALIGVALYNAHSVEEESPPDVYLNIHSISLEF